MSENSPVFASASQPVATGAKSLKRAPSHRHFNLCGITHVRGLRYFLLHFEFKGISRRFYVQIRIISHNST